MFNIIKSEIKRLFKSKGFWLSIAIFILIYSLCIFMLLTSQENGVLPKTSAKPESEFYLSFEFTFRSSTQIIVKSLNSFATTFGHSLGSLILGIYLAIFVCNEYSSGYIKNIATLPNGRLALVVSKIAVAVFIDLIIILLSYGIGFILGNLLIDGFIIESIGLILKSSAVMFIMSLALFSMLIAITSVFRSRVAGIILVLLISSSMLQPLFASLFDLVNLSFLSKYTLSYFFLNGSLVNENEFIRVILISLLYTIIYNGVSIGIIQKRDI